MLTQSIGTSVIARKVSPAALPAHDQFHMIAGQAGLVATEFSYKKDEEIYGEDEPSEYVYQVIRVRSELQAAFRRPASDWRVLPPRRRVRIGVGIGTPPHRGSHRGHDRASGEAAEPRAGGRYHRRSGPQPLVDDRRRTSARRGSYAAPRPQERHGTRRQFSSSGDGPPPGRNGHDGAPDVPQGHRRLSGVALETVSRALSQLHGQGVLGFSGARQIVLRNRQRLHSMDA